MNEMSNKWIGKNTIRPDGAENVTGRAPRGWAPAQLLPSGHGKLSPDHRAHLYGSVLFHRRRRHCA